MDYLTRHYKHLCEQLQERINLLEKFLIERPSIEDQIETGNETIIDVGTEKTKGYAKAGNVKVPFDITIDPELQKSTRGEFRSSNLAVNRRLFPELFADTKELKGTIALNPDLKVNDADFWKAIKDQDTVAHEAAHAHQLAAKTRDAEQRKAQGKTTYADVEIREIEKSSANQRSSNPRVANASPEVKSNLQYSRYYLSPQEVNARSAGAGTMAYRIRLLDGESRNYSFRAPQINAEVGLQHVAGGSNVSPEETAAMTRHERSVAKRKNILAQQDLRNAAARGVLKAEQDMAAPNPEAETTKARQAAIKAKVETLKGKTEQPKILTPEVIPTKTANVASKIIDPTSAAIQATTAQASKIAPQAALKPLPGTQVRGVGAGMSTVAGIAGGLAGEYVVKPAAEKLGVFDAVEKGSRAAFSRMPDWAADVADFGLGAAQVALDPIGSYNEFLVNQARKSPKLTPKDREEAEARYNKQNF